MLNAITALPQQTVHCLHEGAGSLHSDTKPECSGSMDAHPKLATLSVVTATIKINHGSAVNLQRKHQNNQAGIGAAFTASSASSEANNVPGFAMWVDTV